ncbi:transposase [Prosthecobacter sp.]|jgi:hypothetical protein|uniref:transposase n=1 Tax=Prosthecobacter sp. TaxID=1965333 RepID=UPI0037C7D46E
MNALLAERNRLEKRLCQSVIGSLQRQIQLLQNEIAQLDAAIKAHALQHTSLQKSVRLLGSIDGAGLRVALTILAEVHQISASERARVVAAFVGLTRQ